MGDLKNSKFKRFLKKYKFRFTCKHLTSNAGLVPLDRFWHYLGGEAWLDNELGSLKADTAPLITR